jgi:ATP-dependent exoDNAse (exonuclease V) alpha subunit
MGSMTEPQTPFLDLARQSTLTKILTLVQETAQIVASLNQKVTQLMSEDSTVAAEVAQIEVDQQAVLTAIRSQQALLSALQTEVAAGNLSQATLDALTKAQTDMDALNTEAQADVAADNPAPSGT